MQNQRLSILLFLLIAVMGCDQQTLLESDSEPEISNGIQSEELTRQQLLSARAIVEVPAGSVDALADAIAEAGSGGTVLLKAGTHHESNTVTISHPVRIVGENGATLISDTFPSGTTGIMKPALHLLNAPNVVIYGLEILPKEGIGGTAIFIEDSPRSYIAHNNFREHEVSIVVQEGDRASIKNNVIVASGGWLTGEIPSANGILLVNGDFVEIRGNTVSNALLGIFASDRKGLLVDNEMFGNFVGIILCNVPAGVPTPSGEIVGSETNATKWIARRNKSHDNFDIGYLVIDGANQNLLANNEGGNNGRYDIELAGDSERFGFFTPTSRETNVLTGRFGDLVIKDCGVDDTIVGDAILVDTGADPCN